jgi:5-methylcytosine-specific restriction endonuclease McrA
VKKVKSVALDASLLAVAETEAVRRGITFSALVEEALKLYLSVGRLEERLANIETLLMQCLQKETRREPAGQPTEVQRQEPLGGNVWVEVLRRRG